MHGSVGSLKAVVETVGREVVRELRKNQFVNYPGDKGKIGDRTIVLQLILVRIFFFFLMRGVTRAVLKISGKTPEVREELASAVREGRRVSRHSTSRGVEIGLTQFQKLSFVIVFN